MTISGCTGNEQRIDGQQEICSLWEKVLYLLVVLTLIFIWGHSMVPADLSTEESSRFVVLINGVLSSRGSSFSVTDHMVRKTAHFLEYALLGTEISLLKILKMNMRNSGRTLPGCQFYGIPVFIWIGVPVIDEAIQYFTPGRACMWQDVLLDMCGFGVGYFLVLLIFFSLRRCA